MPITIASVMTIEATTTAMAAARARASDRGDDVAGCLVFFTTPASSPRTCPGIGHSAISVRQLAESPRGSMYPGTRVRLFTLGGMV